MDIDNVNKMVLIHGETEILSWEERNIFPQSGTAAAISGFQKAFINRFEITTLPMNQAEVFLKNLDGKESDTLFVFLTAALPLLIKHRAMLEESEVIYWSHNFIYPKLLRRLRKELPRVKIVGVSTYHAGWLASRSFNKNVTCVPNIYEVPVKTHRNVDENSQRIRLAFAGSLSEEKGFGHALDIFERLSREIPLQFDCYGVWKSDQLKLKFNELTQQSSNSTLKYHGSISKTVLLHELGETDILLYGLNASGATESYGLSFIDAQSQGCVPLTLNRGGSIEAIVPEIRKFSVCTNIDKIVGKIRGLDRSQLEQLRADLNIGLEHHLENLTIKRVEPKWVQVFESDNSSGWDVIRYIAHFLKMRAGNIYGQ